SRSALREGGDPADAHLTRDSCRSNRACRALAGEDADAGSGRGDLLAGRLERGMTHEATVLGSGSYRRAGVRTRETAPGKYERRVDCLSDFRIDAGDCGRGSLGSGTHHEAIA